MWLASKESKIDGATIPEVLWGPIIGSPFTGDFRRASVVHDIACKPTPEPKPYSSDEAHRMFYHAMLCDNTAPWLAKVFYFAVCLFGPQWEPGRIRHEPNQDNILNFVNLIRSSDFEAIGSLDELDDYIKRVARQF